MDNNVVFKLSAILGIDTSQYEQGLDGAKGKANTFGGAIGKGLKTAVGIGVKALAGATAAVGAFGASSVKVGADFDKSMSQVAATMGLSMEEMQTQMGTVETAFGSFSGNLREYAQFMGSNTAFSATQAADALNYMALAGYDAQTSMNMLPNVLNLAAAGNMELARASDMVTDTQTAFGISLERTSKMVDEMAKAASTGNTSVEQLGDAFLTVGGLAQELNGGMVTLKDGSTATVDGVQELEIALTAMANAGIKGSEAGTHMRNMLLKLSSPSADGTKALEALGVSVFDTEGNMRSLSGIMGDLNGALSNLTQEQKLQAISDLFNTRDTAAAEALMNAIGEDWDNIGEAILNADGAAQKMADTQLDNLAGDVTLFKSALEGAQIAVSDGLAPKLREFVQFGTDGLGKVTEAFKEGGISGAMEAFGEVLADGVAMIAEVLPEMVSAGAQLLGALGQGLIENAPVLLTAALDIAQYLLQALVDATSNSDNGGGKVIEGLINTFTERLPMFIELGVQLIVNLVNGLASALPTLIPVAVEAILTLVSSLLDNIDGLVDAAINLIMALADGLIAALPVLIEKAPEIVEKLVIAIVNNAPKLIDAAAVLLGKLIMGIVMSLPKLISAGAQIVTSINNGITNFLSKVVIAGSNIIKNVLEGIKSLDPKQWGKDLIDNFINGIKEKWEALKQTVAGVAQSIKDFLGFSEPKLGPLSNFHTYAPDMMDLFAKGIKENEDKVRKQLESSFDFSDTIFNATGKINATASVNSQTVSLLKQIADENKNVTIVLEGDAQRLFRVMRYENSKFKETTGKNAFA